MSGEEDVITPRLRSAMDLAIKLHGNDSRKRSPVPYLAHLLGVTALVQHDGGDEDEAVAALLHDALEDKPEQIDRGAIEREFGQRVAELIDLSIDTPAGFAGGEKAPWKERKQAYLEHAREADSAMLRVTVADKVDNLRATIADYRRLGEPFWGRFRSGRDDQLWYYGGCIEAYREAGFSGPLLDELCRLLEELKGLVARSFQGS